MPAFERPTLTGKDRNPWDLLEGSAATPQYVGLPDSMSIDDQIVIACDDEPIRMPTSRHHVNLKVGGGGGLGGPLEKSLESSLGAL